MTLVDWIAIGVIALAALHGMRRGLVGGAFSLAGLAAGALLGARLAPQFLNDSSSAYVPVVALVGAIGVAVLLQGLASLAGGIVRNTLFGCHRSGSSTRRSGSCSARPSASRSSG